MKELNEINRGISEALLDLLSGSSKNGYLEKTINTIF
jgi:hypothetical protein